MPITHNEETGWGFTHGSQPYVGYATKEEAQAAAYDLERGIVPSTSFERKREIFRMFDEALGLVERHTGDEEPFGALSDGTPITGVVDLDEPGGRAGIVHARPDGFLLTAQDTPNLISIQCQGCRLYDVTIDQVNALRALLATDIPEQLLAAAIAHSRGDDPPPTPAPAIRVEPFLCDDEVDTDHYGTPIGTSYFCGAIEVYVPFDPGQPVALNLPGQEGIALTTTNFRMRCIPIADFTKIATLLNDPRVQAACAAVERRQSKKAA